MPKFSQGRRCRPFSRSVPPSTRISQRSRRPHTEKKSSFCSVFTYVTKRSEKRKLSEFGEGSANYSAGEGDSWIFSELPTLLNGFLRRAAENNFFVFRSILVFQILWCLSLMQHNFQKTTLSDIFFNSSMFHDTRYPAFAIILKRNFLSYVNSFREKQHKNKEKASFTWMCFSCEIAINWSDDTFVHNSELITKSCK